MTANWFTPASGSWLQRFVAGESKSRWRPGWFMCGLRTDSPGARRLSAEWRYRMSSVDSGALVFGRRQRWELVLAGIEPIEPWVEPRTDFLVWAALELQSGLTLELAVERRDAYLITDSSLPVGPD
jgi:hypothetical protein